MIPELIKDFITILSVLAAIAFGYLAFSRGKEQDHKSDATNIATISSDMGYVKAGNDEIKAKLERMDEKQEVHLERIIQVEESTKQAHKRLDGHDARIQKLEGSK